MNGTRLLDEGTTTRTSLEIAEAIESVGGEMNAFTAKEYTCYYARVLDADLPLAIDVMCDLVADSVLAAMDAPTAGSLEVFGQQPAPAHQTHTLPDPRAATPPGSTRLSCLLIACRSASASWRAGSACRRA